ncbi:MAG TPA: hypothetical protein VGC77_04405 [Rhodopseudomonas sp.]|uniref:hypothetical protein n=1 Tax=Rhodopseudomonas sp. TaxID=1078 RepID=UPI002ED8C7F8
MKITNITTSWSSVTTTADEIWSSWNAMAIIDTEPVEADRLGIPLLIGQTIPVPAGTTVYYRASEAGTPVIARVAGL